MGFSIEENIHESESTRTLLAKAIKFNMYIHNIHLHIFSIKQGRSQPFCMEGFLMYLACPIDNRAPEALFTRGVRGHGPPENF